MQKDSEQPESAGAVSSTRLLGGTVEEILRADCYKALQCLYIAVDASIADDVNAKVKAYISALENRPSLVPPNGKLTPLPPSATVGGPETL